MRRTLLALTLLAGIVVAVPRHAYAQSATSIIQQSSRVDSSPCFYNGFRDWWYKIVTCKVVDAKGNVTYVRSAVR